MAKKRALSPDAPLPTGKREKPSIKFVQRLNIKDGRLDLEPAPTDPKITATLLQLPGEIRNTIWKFVMDDLNIALVHFPVHVKGWHEDHNQEYETTDYRDTRLTFQLPQVCRQVYADTSLLLYSETAFTYNRGVRRGLIPQVAFNNLLPAQVKAITRLHPNDSALYKLKLKDTSPELREITVWPVTMMPDAFWVPEVYIGRTLEERKAFVKEKQGDDVEIFFVPSRRMDFHGIHYSATY